MHIAADSTLSSARIMRAKTLVDHKMGIAGRHSPNLSNGSGRDDPGGRRWIRVTVAGIEHLIEVENHRSAQYARLWIKVMDEEGLLPHP